MPVPKARGISRIGRSQTHRPLGGERTTHSKPADGADQATLAGAPHAEDGLNLGTRGQVREMSVLRLYALLTIGFTVGLAIMTVFMNTPPRDR